MFEMKNDWEKLQSSMPKSESFDKKLAESLDEIESEEEFLAKPSLVDDGSTSPTFLAKFEKDDDGDREWTDLMVYDENGKYLTFFPVRFSGVDGFFAGHKKAMEQAKEFALSQNAKLKWVENIY